MDSQQSKLNNKINFSEFKMSIAPGDIILKRGKGPISHTIVNQLKEPIPVSHCAIVVNKDSLVMVNSISGTLADEDGVQLTSLKNFFEDAFPESIYILRSLDTSKSSKIEHEAIRLYEKKIPFDHEFNYLDSSKLYCSEFVENVLFSVYQISFFGRKEKNNRTVLTFNEILRNEHLFIVNQNE